jgi:hypothetical protein
MKPSKGFYSVIQYCPDLGRVEAANIGVLLFCPERRFLKALTNSNNARIIRFFGSEGHDWKRINSIKRGLEDRLQKETSEIHEVDDLRSFIRRRANLVQISEPNFIKVFEPEKDLQELYERIIGETHATRAKRSWRLFIGDRLSTPEIAKKVIREIRVPVPVLGKEVEFPYGFVNGRFNLITPVRFAGAKADTSVATACKYAVEGESLYQEGQSDRGALQLIVVGQFRAQDRESPASVRRILDAHRVKLFESRELPQLIDEIRRTGKDVENKSRQSRK